MKPKKISIGIPTYSQIHIETVACLIYSLQETKAEVQLNFHKGTYLHQLRNNMLKEARENNADYLMFVDSDMTFPPDGIKKLLSYDKDIIGGMYNMKTLPLVNTIKIADDEGNFISSDGAEIPTNHIFKCFSVPTGFMLIKLEAIKSLDKPFDFGTNEKGELIGEDVYFCMQAHKIGLDVWCDPTIKIGHIGEYLY